MTSPHDSIDADRTRDGMGQGMSFVPSASLADLQLQHEIEQFYYRESWLLDNRWFREWLELLDEDIRYFMPIRTNRIQRERALEFSQNHDFAHFDDDINAMRGRLRKLLSDVGWSENPASRTRHVVSNVIVNDMNAEGIYEVSSAFILYRNRLENQVDIFAGERRDVLRRRKNGAGFGISKRLILIDQSTISSNNLSTFF